MAFLALVVISLLGIFIDRTISADIDDPRVRDRIRKEWKNEDESHNRTIARYQAREREYGEREKERERLEEMERARMKLYWADMRPEGNCVGNGMRRHTARLANLNLEAGIDMVVACKLTPVTIYGQKYDSPEECEPGWRVYGHWVVSNDSYCVSFWDTINDKRCTAPGSGLRRFDAKLRGVPLGEDPEVMCRATPATILGHRFERPMSCAYYRLFWGWWGQWWGIWNVPDEKCH